MTIREPLDLVEAQERGDPIPDRFIAKRPDGELESMRGAFGIIAIVFVVLAIAGLIKLCGC